VNDEWLRLVPLPTLEQTRRSAAHVVDNHSWYKHLPFFPPGASFVVFPNPQAGRGVRKDGNRFVVDDIVRSDYIEHHSRLTTAEYLAQFGHWDYRADDNPREPDRQPGPWLYDLDGGRQLLPNQLKRHWSCRLTAFLKPAPPMFEIRATALQLEADAFTATNRLHRIRLSGPGGGEGNEDPTISRYREVAPAMRRAAGSWGDASLDGFKESEARLQLELLLSTLNRVRATWASAQAGIAETNE